LVVSNFAQIFIFESTWYAMVLIQAVFATAAFYGNSMVMWSYVGAENPVDLAGITGSGRMWETIAMLGFFVIVAVVGFVAKWGAVNNARFGQALACLAGAPTLFMAYHKRYPVKKSLKSLAEGSNLYKEGVKDLWRTIVDLGKTNPAAQRYLFTIMFTDAAIGGFTNLAIIYLHEQLQLNTQMVNLFILVNLASNIFGVGVHRFLLPKLGQKYNYSIMVAGWVIVTSLFVGLIAGPEQKYGSFAFAVIYGYCYGHYYPSTNGYFVSLVPEDKQVELWGWNMFASVILSWIPPLVFTTINETSGNLRLAMIGMIGFLLIGFLLSLTIPETSIEKYSHKSTKKVRGEGENDDEEAEKAGADSTDDSGDNQQKAESNV